MVTVFGLGFVGLTTALGFAYMGYRVYGLDVDEERKSLLRKGVLPFLEPEMDTVLAEYLGKNFFVTDDVETAIAESEYVYYCVGTPYGKDGSADLTYLFSAIDETLENIHDEKFRVLVTKSTIPPSTTKEKIAPYVASKGDVYKRLGVANNPEFLREGHCWEDFLNADRIVLGTKDEASREMLVKLYEPLDAPVRCVSWSTGEFIKYLSNTLLATLISYSNEMAHIADVIGDIDISDAFHILHMDKRWNGADMADYAHPGCGYGGYCLPKDTNALYAQSRVKGFEPPILGDVIRTNDERPRYMAERISNGLNPSATIGILGLAFKPGSDDVRDTPAARIIKELRELGYKKIAAYDPVAMEEFVRRYPELPVEMKADANEVCAKAEVVAVVTAWDEFREVVASCDKRVVDCRYFFFDNVLPSQTL